MALQKIASLHKARKAMALSWLIVFEATAAKETAPGWVFLRPFTMLSPLATRD